MESMAFGRFDTLSAYRAGLCQLISLAERQIDWFAPDFADARASSFEIAAGLQRLLASHRTAQIRLLLHDGDYLSQHCPRLIPILTQYSAAFSVRLTDDTHRQQAQCFLIADDRIIRRFHRDHARGESSEDGRALSLPRQQFAEMWESAMPCTDWQRLHL